MAGVNIDILGIRKLKWTEWVNLSQMSIISTNVGTNPLQEMVHEDLRGPLACGLWGLWAVPTGGCPGPAALLLCLFSGVDAGAAGLGCLWFEYYC